MTGEDVKRQALTTMRQKVLRVDDHGNVYAGGDDEAAAALAPCTVLTPEEAERVRRELTICREQRDYEWQGDNAAALALLTPDEADDDPMADHDPPLNEMGC